MLDGGAGNDTISGSAGDDALNGGTGTDALSGGAGLDAATHVMLAAAPAASVSLDDVANDGLPGEGDNYASDIEDVSILGQGVVVPSGSTLIGSAGPNELVTGPGNDTINARSGHRPRDGRRGRRHDRRPRRLQRPRALRRRARTPWSPTRST